MGSSFNIGLVILLASLGVQAAPLDLGDRLEPFFDTYLIEDAQNVSLVLGKPQPEGVVLSFDEPWEGVFSGYVTVLKDDDVFRMYYRGWNTDRPGHEVTCYAESTDGRSWKKPALGLHPYGDRRDTNIILAGMPAISSSFSPFIDRNPAATPETRFKALGGARGGLFALGSADGIHWHLLRTKPVFTEGAFDSQNVPFWSEAEKCYVLYYRVWGEGFKEGYPHEGMRTIARTTSKDFIQWTPPERMTFGDRPNEHLYTNQT
ncbi:MAG TPA: hypothetical protein PLN52_18065, partial [Opitutaceae bacterium]|nr:hypothetical protein [Opitutaceae bacterium]